MPLLSLLPENLERVLCEANKEPATACCSVLCVLCTSLRRLLGAPDFRLTRRLLSTLTRKSLSTSRLIWPRSNPIQTSSPCTRDAYNCAKADRMGREIPFNVLHFSSFDNFTTFFHRPLSWKSRVTCGIKIDSSKTWKLRYIVSPLSW